jgi:hypothetical protein
MGRSLTHPRQVIPALYGGFAHVSISTPRDGFVIASKAPPPVPRMARHGVLAALQDHDCFAWNNPGCHFREILRS